MASEIFKLTVGKPNKRTLQKKRKKNMGIGQMLDYPPSNYNI